MPLQHYPEIESLISWALPNLGGKRVLDVGCGTGGIGFLLRRLPGGNDAYIVGVDGWEPYLEFVRRFNIYDEVHLADLANWTPEPFDIILAVEVLEHLEKEQGLRLLDRLEHAAREVLLVTTPNGDDRRGPVADVPLEAHRSTWHAGVHTKGLPGEGPRLPLESEGKGAWTVGARPLVHYDPLKRTLPHARGFDPGHKKGSAVTGWQPRRARPESRTRTSGRSRWLT